MEQGRTNPKVTYVQFYWEVILPRKKVQGKNGNEVIENVQCTFDPFCWNRCSLTAGECAENTFYPVVQSELLVTPVFGFASDCTVMTAAALESRENKYKCRFLSSSKNQIDTWFWTTRISTPIWKISLWCSHNPLMSWSFVWFFADL